MLAEVPPVSSRVVAEVEGKQVAGFVRKRLPVVAPVFRAGSEFRVEAPVRSAREHSFL